MAISMVRKPSETANITNIDDIIPFRYAYGNQNGYVIGKGTEVSHTVNGNQFTVNSGRLVIQGVEGDIDANGITLTIDTAGETRYYVVYYEVNLATNTANVKLSNFDTVGYPNIDTGDDLTANSSGIARLPLYQFTAKNGVISSVKKVVNAIDYTGTALVGYDNSKGTVEERLTRLGFKQGSAELTGGQNEYGSAVGISDTTLNELKRQGNYVIGSLSFTIEVMGSSLGGSVIIGSISKEYIPTKQILLFLSSSEYLIIQENGNLEFSVDPVSFGKYKTSVLNFGYEAKPL